MSRKNNSLSWVRNGTEEKHSFAGRGPVWAGAGQVGLAGIGGRQVRDWGRGRRGRGAVEDVRVPT